MPLQARFYDVLGPPKNQDELDPYRKKRDFTRTLEPPGSVRTRPEESTFVVHKHAARKLHYDLRLELGGVLKSWTVPKGPSLDPTVKRLAIHVEDHPLEYADFEGTIPKGEYGGGTVLLWDRGRWNPVDQNPYDAYEKGHLKIRFDGEKLQGIWNLVRTGGLEAGASRGNSWLLIKEQDAFAKPQARYDLVEEEPLSVVSGLDLPGVAEKSNTSESVEPRQLGSRPLEEQKADGENESDLDKIKPDPAQLPGAKHEWPEKRPTSPALATLVRQPPEGKGWAHELKWDGYRMLAFLDDGRIRFISRNGRDWTDKFSELCDDLRAFPFASAILDGEVVALRGDGTPDFQLLQNAFGISRGQRPSSPLRLFYYVFDILACNGYDLRGVPFGERKEFLERVFAETSASAVRRIGVSQHIEAQGPEVYEHVCSLNLEGIVSKRLDSVYREGRSRDWVKVKCTHRQEFVIGGYLESRSASRHLRSLLLGYYDRQGRLIYSGKVGTGFTANFLVSLKRELEGRRRADSPFAEEPDAGDPVHWVEPYLVAEVEYSGWTRDGRLRQPSFQGLRPDKDPLEVGIEVAQSVPASSSSRTSSRGVTEVIRPKETGVAGVALTNPGKVLFPTRGITKVALARYVATVAHQMLPHVAERPLTLLRCPDGVTADCFYQKHLDSAQTGSLSFPSVEVKEKRTEGTKSYIYVRDKTELVSLVQLGVLEIHPWGSSVVEPDVPDRLIFDLDPAPDVSWGRIVETARVVRELLSAVGLLSFVKTTGGKGLHVVVPIRGCHSWVAVKDFARAVAVRIAGLAPGQITPQMAKSKRSGKIYIDYLRNARGATAIAPYCMRARPGAPVAMPVDWEDLENLRSPEAFTVETAPEWLEHRNQEPWAGFFDLSQVVTDEVRRGVE